MEAALGHEAAAAAQAAGAVPPPHQPAVAARQLSGTGLPPRGPAPRSHAGITLEAAFADDAVKQELYKMLKSYSL